MTKTGHSSTGKTVALASMWLRVAAGLALCQPAADTMETWTSPNASARDVVMSSEACLFGKWLVTPLQEISLGWSLHEDPEA